MWESRALERGFSKQLWESASRRSCRRPPIVLRISIAAAFSTGRFLFLFWSFFLFLTSFPCGKPAGSRYELRTLLRERLGETFERDQHGERDVCSDDVLRGLGYKGYGQLSAGEVARTGNNGEA
jgi:hypothetical protein